MNCIRYLTGQEKAVCALLLLCAVLPPDFTYAAATFGTAATGASTDLLLVGGLLSTLAYLGGAAFVILSLFAFKQLSNQPGSPKGPAIACFVIGIALLALPSIITMGTGTLGVTDAGSSKLGIK